MAIPAKSLQISTHILAQYTRKLAMRGMAIQELDIKIHHRPGHSNANADAFSRAPLFQGESPVANDVEGVVAALKPMKEDLATLQKQDAELVPIVTYLETGLSADKNGARQIALIASSMS